MTTITKLKLGISNNIQNNVVYRLKARALFLKEFQELKSHELLEEAAEEIENLRKIVGEQDDIIVRLEKRLEKEDDWK